MSARRKPDAFIGDHALRPESLMSTYAYDAKTSRGSLKQPIFQTSTYVFKDAAEGAKYFGDAKTPQGPEEGTYAYTRINNPGLELLEDRLVLWDDAESCAVFDSGMAAISTSLLAHLRPGDVVLHSEPVYGSFIKAVLEMFKIDKVPFLAGSTPEQISDTLKASGKADRLKVIYVETPANPTNMMTDIAACAALAKANSTADRQVLVVVDNTFLGPIYQTPLKHGADIVLYSATKYIGGHSDVIGGAALGATAVMKPVRRMRSIMGTAASPLTTWLLQRSLETLKLRVTAIMKNARHVADFLADHPKIDKVNYLGLLSEEEPQYALYRKQCLGPGGMMSFYIKGGQKEAHTFLNNLKLFKLAVSLGGTESLAQHPASMTHAEYSPDDRARVGIPDSMVRLSIGVEHYDDLIVALDTALNKV